LVAFYMLEQERHDRQLSIDKFKRQFGFQDHSYSYARRRPSFQALWRVSYVMNHSKGGKTMIPCQVNGVQRSFDGDPEMPLLWYLRDQLQLTGSKYGCGIGLCGACTVHVDGAATRSCLMTMSSATGKDIVTIEGLSTNGDHPVQQAWKTFNVPQCGYCQSGQIMQAVALLKGKPKPTDQDIDEAMQGNICRCGTYQRIRQAIKQAGGVQG
jgi:isoquinoline 1-oxidoreductase subunit alpha